MTPQQIGLLLITVIIGAVGQFFLKAGAVKILDIQASNWLNQILGIITIPELIIGFACYGLGSIGFVALLSKVNLNIVGPAIASSYVISVLIGTILFREALPLSRFIGVSLIVAGVILVVWKH